MPDVYLHATLFASVCLLVGFALRTRLGLLRTLYVPASVVGGLVAFALMQTLLRVGPGGLAYVSKDATFVGDPAAWQTLAAGANNVLRTWPGFLIAVVFAGLLLERPGRPLKEAAAGAARQGVVAWVIILGEVVIGLLALGLVARPLGSPPVPDSFGQMIEAGFAGGHGTAAAMGTVFSEQLGFEPGLSIAVVFATYGLIFGTLAGIVLVNVGVRRGWLGRRADLDAAAADRVSAEPAARATVPAGVIDPFVFQVLLVALAVLVGYLLQIGYELLAAAVLPPDRLRFAGNVPLFLFTLLGGWLVRRAFTGLGIGHLIDPASVQRVMGVAIEFLIVAAIASLQVEAALAYWLPTVVLLAAGSAWAVFCLLVVGRWLLPRRYWFELGLINFGMSTATTAQGMLLLRIVDPELESGAAEDYAAAAPLTAPFIGGGILTVAGIPIALVEFGLWPVTLAGVVILVGLLGLGYALKLRSPA